MICPCYCLDSMETLKPVDTEKMREFTHWLVGGFYSEVDPKRVQIEPSSLDDIAKKIISEKRALDQPTSNLAAHSIVQGGDNWTPVALTFSFFNRDVSPTLPPPRPSWIDQALESGRKKGPFNQLLAKWQKPQEEQAMSPTQEWLEGAKIVGLLKTVAPLQEEKTDRFKERFTIVFDRPFDLRDCFFIYKQPEKTATSGGEEKIPLYRTFKGPDSFEEEETAASIPIKKETASSNVSMNTPILSTLATTSVTATSKPVQSTSSLQTFIKEPTPVLVPVPEKFIRLEQQITSPPTPPTQLPSPPPTRSQLYDGLLAFFNITSWPIRMVLYILSWPFNKLGIGMTDVYNFITSSLIAFWKFIKS